MDLADIHSCTCSAILHSYNAILLCTFCDVDIYSLLCGLIPSSTRHCTKLETVCTCKRHD